MPLNFSPGELLKPPTSVECQPEGQQGTNGSACRVYDVTAGPGGQPVFTEVSVQRTPSATQTATEVGGVDGRPVVRLTPEELEELPLTLKWRTLLATYVASDGDPAVRQQVLRFAENIRRWVPELLELNPVPYTGPEPAPDMAPATPPAQSLACPSFKEDPCVCDSTGEPKGQCENCGDHEGVHVAPSVFPAAPEG